MLQDVLWRPLRAFRTVAHGKCNQLALRSAYINEVDGKLSQPELSAIVLG